MERVNKGPSNNNQEHIYKQIIIKADNHYQPYSKQPFQSNKPKNQTVLQIQLSVPFQQKQIYIDFNQEHCTYQYDPSIYYLQDQFSNLNLYNQQQKQLYYNNLQNYGLYIQGQPYSDNYCYYYPYNLQYEPTIVGNIYQQPNQSYQEYQLNQSNLQAKNEQKKIQEQEHWQKDRRKHKHRRDSSSSSSQSEHEHYNVEERQGFRRRGGRNRCRGWRQKNKNEELSDQKVEIDVQFEAKALSIFEDANFNEKAIEKFKKRLRKVTIPQQKTLLINLLQKIKISPQFKSAQKIKPKKLVNIIYRNNFQQTQIFYRISQISKTKQKKLLKQKQFNEQYPNPILVPFQQKNHLLDFFKHPHTMYNTIMLIDGNNIMNTCKHFRRLFQSQDFSNKAQAQLRLQWLIGYVIDQKSPLTSCLFFDDKFDHQIYQWLSEKINATPQIMKRIMTIYPNKSINPTEIADDKIVSKLQQITEQLKKLDQKDRPNILLVTADKLLIQKCAHIYPIMRTSGRQFIPFCRKYMKFKYENAPQMKNIVKQIFNGQLLQ